MKTKTWFTKARHGLLIHYGLFSLLERGEWAWNREEIPLEIYKALARQTWPAKTMQLSLSHLRLQYPARWAARRRPYAFTILELLVATTLLMLIVALLGGVVSTVGSAWRSAAGQNERELSARAISDFIHTDLKAAILPLNAAASGNLQFILNPSGTPQCADALFWQAPVATEMRFGDIAEVGYFVRWIDGSPPKPVLCRFFVNSAMVDPANPSGTIDDPHFKIYSAPNNWLEDIDAVAPGTAEKSYTGLFADHIVAIWFRCLDDAGKAFGRAFDSRVGQNDSSGILRRLPASVQVSFVVLDSRAAGRLTQTHEIALKARAQAVADGIAAGNPNDDTISPAQEFSIAARADPALRDIAASLYPHTTTVRLPNSQ